MLITHNSTPINFGSGTLTVELRQDDKDKSFDIQIFSSTVNAKGWEESIIICKPTPQELRNIAKVLNEMADKMHGLIEKLIENND